MIHMTAKDKEHESNDSEIDILVVEDEPADANLIREMLCHCHDIEVAGDVSTAVSTIQSLAAKDDTPELVLLDLRLPDGSGFDVLRELQNEKQRHQFSIVVLSNSDADTDRKRAKELDVDEFQTKPMDIDDFERVIADIEQRFVLNEDCTIY